MASFLRLFCATANLCMTVCPGGAIDATDVLHCMRSMSFPCTPPVLGVLPTRVILLQHTPLMNLHTQLQISKSPCTSVASQALIPTQRLIEICVKGCLQRFGAATSASLSGIHQLPQAASGVGLGSRKQAKQFVQGPRFSDGTGENASQDMAAQHKKGNAYQASRKPWHQSEIAASLRDAWNGHGVLRGTLV